MEEGFNEWLAANRRGHFAMGTPTRIASRKYHGLLVARLGDPVELLHVLTEVGERVVVDGEAFELAVFDYGEVRHPAGDRHLVEFSDRPVPTWTYQLGRQRLVRSLAIHPTAAAVRLDYRIEGPPAGLEIDLFAHVTGRDAHGLAAENHFLDGAPIASGEGTWTFAFYGGLPPVRFSVGPGAEFLAGGFWNRGVRHRWEAERGYDDLEDLFCPGPFRVEAGRREFSIVVGLGEDDPGWPATPAGEGNGFVERLERAADAFLIESPDGGPAVVAGYPWFGCWGRDTLIALPGLTLARDLFDEARALLDHVAASRVDGLVPNLFAVGKGPPDLHSVDASLWWARAVGAVDAATGEGERWGPALFDLLEALREGRRPGIAVDRTGLLAADRRPRAMTWMDALVDGRAVTPRAPYAVEVEALFASAIDLALDLAGRLGRTGFAGRWRPVRERLRTAFESMFWLPDRGHLADAHDGSAPDPALRPNQLLALVGPDPLVTGRAARSVLEAVRRDLLTPIGLRTLAPGDPAYVGRCVGSQAERDRAYHQGTVWPWLLGPYVDAVAAVEGPSAAGDEAGRILDGLVDHLDVACLGQVSEIADGDPPHTPRGAPAQAWSVAEILRLATWRPVEA